MPMLRCLDVPRTLQLLSALLSKKRIIFTNTSLATLSSVSYGAAAMMGQGLLPPPSVFVPVLPPGLVSLLQSPSAYLIGVLQGPSPHNINLPSVPKLAKSCSSIWTIHRATSHSFTTFPMPCAPCPTSRDATSTTWTWPPPASSPWPTSSIRISPRSSRPTKRFFYRAPCRRSSGWHLDAGERSRNVLSS
mmetsp:Transcript_42025/g.88195  ORF Transcript_42025/g.88195 Transcript_42025/m.88195 type:complete len:190 (-) Transcript_42025:110-679(-)